MQVPSGAPTSRIDSMMPALTLISVPVPGASEVDGWPARARVRSVKCDTEAMLGSASPRNPSVRIAPRSSARRILLVACRSIASRASSASIPSPSSSTRISRLPPVSTAIATRDAPASMAFSTSSLTTEAGRSTTSPAAIWFASSGDRGKIRDISDVEIWEFSDPAAIAEVDEHGGDDAAHDAHQDPEHGQPAEAEMRQLHVHAVEPGDE